MVLSYSGDFGSSAPFAGPGHLFTAKSTIGALPGHTYQLNARVLRLPTLTRVCEITNTNYTPGSNWDAVWGAIRNPPDVVSVAEGGGVFGDNAVVQLTLNDLTGNVVADGPTTFDSQFYDPVCQQYVCRLFSAGSGSGSGFNQGDRDQLTAVHNATVRAAYTVTTTHVGLVDNGSITTLNLTRALRVTVTAFPPNADRAVGTPQYFFDLGFFTLNATQGWVKSQRLVFEFQLYEAPQSLDSFGWTLTPGTTINVEELAPT